MIGAGVACSIDRQAYSQSHAKYEDRASRAIARYGQSRIYSVEARWYGGRVTQLLRHG
jgi:hypothetical protein